MAIIGAILLILGLIFAIKIVWIIGLVLLVVGLILWIRPVGGRRIY